jgi:methyl-accepting chemotaxis protein
MNPHPQRVRMPIGRRLLAILALLFGVIVVIGAFTFFTLERVVSATDRVGTRYAPQSERMAAMEVLMFRISLEARHAMLVQTPQALEETLGRIGTLRQQLLEQVDAFERDVTTDRGRAFVAEWRERDAVFWRSGGQTLAKVKAGDVEGAFQQLETELVGARNAVLDLIGQQRAFQSALMLSAVGEAEDAARRAEIVVPSLALLGLTIAGLMSWRLASMMQGAFGRARAVMARIAGGDLADEVWVRQGDEFGHLFDAIVQMQLRLNEVVQRVRDVAVQVGEAAREIDGANAELAEVTRSHETAVDGTRAVTLQMNQSMSASAEHAVQANELATRTAQVATAGGEMIAKVVQTMSGIDESSRRIGEIVGVIDGIAFQTNILALNAAVEAARAGEHGRGFAVVAAEVRGLAQRSAQAAREVKTLIGASVERVQTGSDTVDEAGRTLQGVVASVEQVTRLIEDLARGTREHTAGFAGITRSVDDIDQKTRMSARAVQRSGEAANRLREHAQGLERAVAAFNIDAR